MSSLKEERAKKKLQKKVKYDFKDIFSLAMKYIDEGDFDYAIENFTNAIKLKPNNANAYNNRGVCFYKQGNYELALNDYNLAIELYPNFYEVYFNRGFCFYIQGNYELALNDYNLAIDLYPNFYEVYFNRGLYYYEQEKYELSLKYYNLSIELNPNDAEAYTNRGLCYYKKENYKLALKDCNLAIELNPNDAKAYNNRGLCFYIQEKYEIALKDYNLAIELNPNDAKAYINRGACYAEQKNYELALKDYNLAIELNPNDAEAYYSRGVCFYKQEKNEFALKDYKLATQLNPNFKKIFKNRGSCYSKQKNYNLALKDYDKAIELYHNFYETYCDRGLCYYQLENYELALKDFEQAIELDDSLKLKKELYFLSSNVCISAKNYPEAKNYIKKAFENASSEELRHKEVYLSGIDNTEEIYRKNQELEEKNKKLELKSQQNESLQNRMQKLVEQFTHSLGNVIFPDNIYQVAERLKNNPEYRKDVLLLHEAYHSEIIIKLQGELLRQRYANTNPEKFRQFIRSCRRLPNNADNTKSIEDILDYAASRVTARFLNQHYAGLNTIRDKILSNKGVDINTLKQKFEDDILLNKSSRPIIWINENLRPVQITELSPLWNKVRILAESHAEALLFGYFSEILFNAFKYADHDKEEFLTLIFDESVIDDKTYLACHWKNPVKDNTPLLGTGKGLDAIQEDLKQLNDTENTENPEQSLLINQQDNQFEVTLFFNKDLLIDDLPILTRKRK